MTENIALNEQTLNQSNKQVETKDIITPYAFAVDDNMLGAPIATPTKRALAMFIDICCIFLAGKISAFIISFAMALAFYKDIHHRYLADMSLTIQRTIKIISATVLFISSLVLLSLVIDYVNDSDIVTVKKVDESAPNQHLNDYIVAYLQTVDDINCHINCKKDAWTKLLQQEPELKEIEEFSYLTSRKTLLKAIMLANIKTNTDNAEQIIDEDDTTLDTIPSKNVTQSNNNAISAANAAGKFTITTNNKLDDSTEDKIFNDNPYSILSWGKGLIEDLGLGFGWAALYFTLLPFLWRGQTIGKKICNIRTVCLSGKYLNLWECFGRYGGYGAGFATGLLGFLQIYWDPNRQAIQDKISATVVIKGNLPPKKTQE